MTPPASHGQERAKSSGKRPRHFRPTWNDQPAFADASASISASSFGARRLIELEHLREAVASTKRLQDEHVALLSGGGQTSSRHLRRRTTSHQSRRHRHRFPHDAVEKSSGTATRKSKRSSLSTLRQGHYAWQDQPSDTAQQQQQQEPHWMETHVWHAKRFHMESLWGWRVPLVHTNRGGRAILRLSSQQRRDGQGLLTPDAHHVTLQDLTYCRQPLPLRIECLNGNLQALIQSTTRILPDWNNATNHPTIMAMLATASSRKLPQSKCCCFMGEGMLHAVDQFPRGAIGPVWWQVTKEENSSTQWRVDLRAHPSIRSAAMKCLEELLECTTTIQRATNNGIEQETADAANLQCCFRICGQNATTILQTVLKPRSEADRMDKEWNWEDIVALTTISSTATSSNKVPPSSPFSTDSLLHGSVVRVLLHTQGKDEMVNGSESSSSLVPALLVRQLPRPLTCDANRAMSGWDLYCPAKHAVAIWMALAWNSVVIGMVEQAHLQLECEPPIPIFPRDYMDTLQSRKYWAANNKEDDDNDHGSWNLIRRLYEGGWGRLPIRKQNVYLRTVSWNSLVESSVEESKDEESAQVRGANFTWDMVVVRGAFGQPFVAALVGCGRMVEQENKTKESASNRRKRRRSTHPFSVKRAQPLSQEELAMWQQMVKNLRDNLSLPAVLQTHIRCVGSGTIHPGDEILVGDNCVGFATAGSFSPARGVCHGLAVVGASRILEALVSSKGAGLGRVVRLIDGKSEMQLAGSIRTGPGRGSFEITISLILQGC